MTDAQRALARALDALLPQTQCTRCGYADCRAYAEAIAQGDAPIDRCPPGGAEGVARLAVATGRPVVPLDPAHGREAPRRRAVIDEAACIGCTLCIQACPVDCIVGAPKLMHTVIAAQCTGCELCLPVCPVDCIALVGASGERSGWAAWSAEQAAEARASYRFRTQRLQRDDGLANARPSDDVLDAPVDQDVAAPSAESGATDRRRAAIDAALARARQKAP